MGDVRESNREDDVRKSNREDDVRKSNRESSVRAGLTTKSAYGRRDERRVGCCVQHRPQLPTCKRLRAPVPALPCPAWTGSSFVASSLAATVHASLPKLRPASTLQAASSMLARSGRRKCPFQRAWLPCSSHDAHYPTMWGPLHLHMRACLSLHPTIRRYPSFLHFAI